jgi:predicted nuclease of predicted toxin-antitoxin system
VRFFIDECISPSLSQHLNQNGQNDAIHPRDRGRLRDPDHVVFIHAIEDDRIIVTENADDFKKLATAVDLHPGLIILPSVARLDAQRLMDIVVAHLVAIGGKRPEDQLVNSVLTITIDGAIQIHPLPPRR